MKTELQRNLLIFLQRHIKKVEDVKPEGLTTPKFNDNIVSKQSTHNFMMILKRLNL